MRESIADLLLDCLHQDAGRVDAVRLGRLGAETWEQARALSASLRVQELLLARLTERGLESAVPGPTLAAMRAAGRASAIRNLGILRDLERLGRGLAAAAIPAIVLKGAHLAQAVYANAALRSMLDVDLLVRAGDLSRAAAALAADGYAPRTPYDEGADLTATYAYHLPRFTKRGAVAIELHWRISPPNRFCATDDLWNRAVPLGGGGDWLALCPEDLVLHLCAHASHHHQFQAGLRPACDVAETASRFVAALDWTVLVARARTWRWDRGTYLALRLSRDMLGAAVPDAALRDLRPADVDDALVAAARTLILLDRRTHLALPPSPLRATDAGSPRARFTVFLRRIFPRRALIAGLYRVTPRSPRLFLYYLLRLKDLMASHARVVLQLLRGDPLLTPIASQKTAIRRWLARGR